MYKKIFLLTLTLLFSNNVLSINKKEKKINSNNIKIFEENHSEFSNKVEKLNSKDIEAFMKNVEDDFNYLKKYNKKSNLNYDKLEFEYFYEDKKNIFL